MQRSDPNAKRDETEREFTTAEHRSLLTPLKNKFCPSRLQQQRERARRQKLGESRRKERDTTLASENGLHVENST